MKNWAFLILLSLTSCLEHIDTRKIKIVNETNKNIYVFDSQNDTFTEPYISYPLDTLLKYEKSEMKNPFYMRNVIGWKSYIEDSKEGKMRIFLVEQDSIDKYGIKNILEKSIYTKVYKVDIQDLKDCDWEIVYRGK